MIADYTPIDMPEEESEFIYAYNNKLGVSVFAEKNKCESKEDLIRILNLEIDWLFSKLENNVEECNRFIKLSYNEQYKEVLSYLARWHGNYLGTISKSRLKKMVERGIKNKLEIPKIL